VTRRRRLFGILACGHDPQHQPQGGFRCSRCGLAGADLEEFGFVDEGYVSEEERRRLARSAAAPTRDADDGQ
jgi:hypothetical protein